MKNFIYGILMTGVIVLSGTSCQNELTLPEKPKTDSIINLVHTPDVISWSGEETLGNTFGSGMIMTRGLVSSDSHTRYKVQDNPLTDNLKEQNPKLYEVMTHAPSAVSDDEWNFVKEYLAQHPNEGGTVCDLTDYFIQWAGKSYAYYDGFQDNNDAEHNVIGSNQMDYIVIDGEHLPDYNGDWGPIEYLENWPLNNPTYHDSYGDVDQIKENMYRFYYIQYNGEWGLYLCFDYTTKKNNGEYLPGDGIFNDWVLKITPADGSKLEPPTQGETPKDEESNVKEYPHKDEVEVNYAILDSHERKDGRTDISDLVTKLSIHVRKATDVTITILIPIRYVVESDDLYIFEEHYVDGVSFDLEKPKPDVITYNIAGETITLSVSFEENNIVVNITGITQEVIDYCWENNKDGVNFEIYNYFQTEEWNWIKDDSEKGGHGEVSPTGPSREDLFECMNKATIEFSENPNYYINAFGWNDSKEDYHPWHSFVTPISEEYSSPVRGNHLNGTPYNDIYVKNGVGSDKVHN